MTWGDGGTTTFFAATTGELADQEHTYPDSGSYTATVKVTDKDNDHHSRTFQVVVDNVAPTATLQAPPSIDEGGTITLG